MCKIRQPSAIMFLVTPHNFPCLPVDHVMERTVHFNGHCSALVLGHNVDAVMAKRHQICAGVRTQSAI
jgi:hypothetical protein